MGYGKIHIPLVRGVDTKLDARAMPAPKLSSLENAQFEHPGGLDKAPGSIPLSLEKAVAGGGVFIVPEQMRGLGAVDMERLLFAEGVVYSRADVLAKWAERERYESVLVESQEQVLAERVEQLNMDRAEVSDVILRTWSPYSGSLRVVVSDKGTGTLIVQDLVVGGSRGACRTVGTKLHAYYVQGTTLYVDVIDPADPVSTIGAAVGISLAAMTGVFDVCVYGGFAYVAYVVAGGASYTVLKVSSAGAVVTSSTKARAATAIAISAYNSKIGVARLLAASTEIRFDWLKSDLSDDPINVLVTSGADTLGNLTTLVRTASALVLYDTNGGAGLDRVDRVSITTGGVASAVKVLARGSNLGSRLVMWIDDTEERALVHVCPDDGLPIQPCWFLLDADFYIGDTNGGSLATENMLILARILPQSGGDQTSVLLRLPQIEDLGGGRFAYLTGTKGTLTLDGLGIFFERGLCEVIYKVADPRAYRTVQEGACAYIPGGIVGEYDGTRAVENGFLLFPEDVVAVSLNDGSGTLTPGDTYTYAVTFERKNARNEISRSTYAAEKVVPIGVGHNAVSLTIRCLHMTLAPNEQVYIVIWRSLKNEATPYFRLTEVHPALAILNDINADAVVFIDKFSDTGLTPDLADREQFYLSPSEQGTPLEPTSFPPTTFLATGHGRLWTLDPGDPHKVWHSKIRGAGETIHGQDAIYISVPQDGGDMVGLAITDVVTLFKERAVYVTVGLGPDNNGGGPYPVPTLLAPIGCTEARSICVYPGGVAFKGDKGIYTVDRGSGVRFIGAQVALYNDATIVGAVHVPDKHQIHFVTAAHGTLMFDYAIEEWSVLPNRSGTTAVLWQGAEVARLVDGEAPHIPQDTFAEGSTGTTGYALDAETAWIKASDLPDISLDLQGWARLRSLFVLGEYRSAHRLRVRVAFDYLEDVYPIDETMDPVSPSGGVLTAGMPEQVRVGVQRKFQAFKVRITDSAPAIGTWREGLRLTAITAEVALIDGTQVRVGTAQQT